MAEKGLDRSISILEEQLSKVAPGSEEQERIVRNLKKLYEQQLEEEKAGADYDEMSGRLDALEADSADKKKSSLWNNILRTVEVGGGIVGGALWFLFNNQAFHETLDFEKTGTPSSNSFRTIYRNISDFHKRKKK